MNAAENMQDFYDYVTSILPDGVKIIGKIKQNRSSFRIDLSVPFGFDHKQQSNLSWKISERWNFKNSKRELPDYEIKVWNGTSYTKKIEKVTGRYYIELKVTFKFQKGDVKITWENFEEVVQHYNDEALGKFFFPKSTGRYDKTFDKSISVGYIEPDGTHYLYTVAAPSGILTKMSHLLAQGQTAIDIVRQLQDSAVTWKE